VTGLEHQGRARESREGEERPEGLRLEEDLHG
jgi:hypothetical protein